MKRKMKIFYETGGKNASLSPFIVEGDNKETVVKVHKQKYLDLCKTEDSCKYSMKHPLKTPLPVPL